MEKEKKSKEGDNHPSTRPIKINSAYVACMLGSNNIVVVDDHHHHDNDDDNEKPRTICFEQKTNI